MEDKMFDLMERMYSDLINRFENEDKKIESIIKEQQRQGIILENEIRGDLQALYDGYKQTYEKLVAVENKVDSLSSTVDKQEIELKVVKGGK